MFLHKLKLKMCPQCTETKKGKIVELLTIFLATELLLLTVWLHLNQLFQLLGIEYLRHYMPSVIVDKVQEYAGTVGVLGTLLIALLTLFGIEEMQILREHDRLGVRQHP